MLSSLTPHEANIKKWLIPVTRSEIDKRLNNNPKLRRFMTRLAILLRTSFLILTLICASQTMARSQKYKVTIKVKEQKLLDVFKSIQQQTNLIVFYSNTILNDQEKVSIQVKDEPLEKVLDKIIAGKALKYEVQAKYIVIAPKEEKKGGREIKEGMSVENIAPLPPPTIDVSGKVTDEDGNPLAGASVKVKNAVKGTVTNEEGIFMLNNVSENSIISVEFVGYASREIRLSNNQKVYTVRLTRITSELQEVVIGKGYYEEKQKYSVGNSVRITAKDIEKQPVSNPLLALQGRVPGLEVTQTTGMNGGAVEVRVQGQNSLRSGSDPLIIVDGVPFPTQFNIISGDFNIINEGSPLNYVNPTDIETIDVLKDADATAIYGSRAANGAIIITTKKGRVGKISVKANIQQGWGKVTSKVDMLNTRQYLDMRYEALKNDGIDWRASSYSANDLKLWDTTRYTDWQKELLGGTASYTNLNLSISGGSSTSQYLIGGTFNRTTTVFPGNFDNKNGSLHFNIGARSPNQRFHIQLGGSYMLSENGLPSDDLTDQAVRFEPNAPALYKPDGTLNWETNAAGNSTWANPLQYLLKDFSFTSTNLMTNASLTYKILSGLEIKTNVGYTSLQGKSYTPFPVSAEPPQRQATHVRSTNYNAISQNSWSIEPQISYDNSFNKVKLNVLVGTTIQQQKGESTIIQGSGYSSDQLLRNLSAALTTRVANNQNAYKYNALFGRVNLVYDDQYLLNITARRDGSSRFGANNQFHNFGSIGTGWIFSQNNFIKRNLSFLSFGKIRGSWGTTGSDQIADYSHLSLYAVPFLNIPYQGVQGLFASNISNPYIGWEETKKLQGGIDLGFLLHRVSISITYAINRSSNQLLQYSLPITTGFTGINSNFPATVQNTSWEFVLNSSNLTGKNFTWKTSLNITIPRNKLIDFPGIENSSYASVYVIGQPINVQKVYKFMGVDPAIGRYVFGDLDGNPTLIRNSEFRNGYISAFTQLHGGLINSFSFKGFQLDILFQFVRKMGPSFFYNGQSSPGAFASGASNQPIIVLNRWQKPGDITSINRYTTNALGTVRNGSDAGYSYDNSFIRLKNLSIAWQLPESLCKKFKIQNGNIYFRGQNLLTISKFNGLDPETSSITTLPPLRLLTAGITITL